MCAPHGHTYYHGRKEELGARIPTISGYKMLGFLAVVLTVGMEETQHVALSLCRHCPTLTHPPTIKILGIQQDTARVHGLLVVVELVVEAYQPLSTVE